MAKPNMFDNLEELGIALDNGINELERDYGCPEDPGQYQAQIIKALGDLYTARRKLKEATT